MTRSLSAARPGAGNARFAPPGTTSKLAVDRGAARRDQGVLDTANEGKVKLFILAAVARNPLFTADQIRDMLGGEFGPHLMTPHGEVVPLPPVRTFQRALQIWKERHAAELVRISDPDQWNSKYRLSGSNSFAHISRPHQLWMIDASPADMLCVDGRYAIYAVVDIATRRLAYPRASGRTDDRRETGPW